MNKIVYILGGPPGAGKSYFAKNTLIKDDSWAYISRDEIRYSLLKPYEGYFAREKQVYQTFIDRIKEALHSNKYQYVVIDATHLNSKSRATLINAIGFDYTDQINIIWFKTPLPTCLERNAERAGRQRVPDNTIIKMFTTKSNPSTDDFIKYHAIYEVYPDKGMILVEGDT